MNTGTENIGKNHLSEFAKLKPGTAPAPADPPATSPAGHVDTQTAPPVITSTGNQDPPANTGKEDSDPPVDPPTQVELNDELILNYFKEKRGKELSSLDELFKANDPAKDPTEKYSAPVKGFLKFHEDTGRGYEEFQALNKDWDAMKPIEVARQKAIETSGGVLHSGNVDAYLEKKLNIDLEDPGEFDDVEVRNYNSDYLVKKITEKEKYKLPKEAEKTQDPNQPKTVTLENGTVMTEQAYNKLVDDSKKYLNDLKSAADKITHSHVQIKFDDNGVEKPIDLAYEFNKDERHRMLESSSDPVKFLQETFKTKDGYDYAGLQIAMEWANPVSREKMISAIANKAIGAVLKDFNKQRTNANFTQNRMPTNTGGNKKVIPIPGTQQAYGIRFPKEQFK